MAKLTKKRTVISLAKWTGRLSEFAHIAVLRRYRTIEVVILVLGALISLGLASFMLFSAPSTKQSIIVPAAQLETDTVDELELLIEVRNTTYENPPIISGQVFGR